LLMSRGSLEIFARGPITIVFWLLTALSIVLIIRSTMAAARIRRAQARAASISAEAQD
jgi:putative tricarboxylic transport membrane protein